MNNSKKVNEKSLKKDYQKNSKKVYNKSDRAITLIALIVTIVILIILAGVLINISLGNNGLFNKAKTAKEMYTNAQDYEEKEIEKVTNSIDSYTSYVANGTVKAEDVGYTNPNWAGIKNVKQALDYLYNN